MAGVDDIIKQWVERVERTGELRSIDGFGKPLNLDDGFAETPEELRMAHKVLKNAGYVPAEIEMLQKLASLREELGAAAEPDRQQELKVMIAELQQKVSMMFEAMRRR